MFASIEIKKYRGFANAEAVFALPNGQSGSGMTIILGPNGSGKTSVFEALAWASLKDVKLHEIKLPADGMISVTSSEGKKNKILGVEGDKPKSHFEFEIKGTDFIYISSEAVRLDLTGDFEKVSRSYYDYPDISRLSPMSSMLKARSVSAVLSDPSLSVEFLEYARNLVSDLDDFRIEMFQDQGALKFIRKDGSLLELSSLGNGIGAALYILAEILLLKGGSPKVILMDEPELYMHPQLQREMHTIIRKVAATHQLIINTHSPHFLHWGDLSVGSKIVRTFRTRDGLSKVKNISAEALGLFAKSTSDWQRPHLFDAVAKELFFAKKVLFVEGQEDVGLIRKFAREKAIDLNFEVFGYGAGGAGNIFGLMGLGRETGVSTAALFDGNATIEYQKCVDLYSQSAVKILPEFDIRDKPDKNIVGMFDVHGLIKPTHEDRFKNIILELNVFFEEELI